MTTDAGWQKDFVRPGTRYTNNTLYHEKALYWKFGKETAKKVPLTFEIGIQMFTQFGGKAYNVAPREVSTQTMTVEMPQNLKAFVSMNRTLSGMVIPVIGALSKARPEMTSVPSGTV